MAAMPSSALVHRARTWTCGQYVCNCHSSNSSAFFSSSINTAFIACMCPSLKRIILNRNMQDHPGAQRYSVFVQDVFYHDRRQFPVQQFQPVVAYLHSV